MYKSKKYVNEWDDVQDGVKSSETMVPDILADPEFAQLEEVVIGFWGESWDDGAQAIIDGIVANKEKFAHIKSLFIGDMEYDECEVSWIIQADYSALWAAMPQLEKLTIKGSEGLTLGEISHDKLESLEIICGGLPEEVIGQIQKARLPELNRLLLYIGIDAYGFDGDIHTIKSLLEKSDFPKLQYLGITDSEIQDEITEAALQSKYMSQIETLDLSMGTLTDKGAQKILDRIGNYPNIKKLDVHFNYVTDEMYEKLMALPIEVNAEEREEADEYDGEIYYYPMLTE